MIKRIVAVFFYLTLISPTTWAQYNVPTDMGPVTLPTRPVRIVTLEHRYTEMVLSLGVAPVGVADIKSYSRYDGIEKDKLTNTKDIGTRASPSLEAILAVKPDLIIGTRLRNEGLYKQLSSIAPTLLFDGIEITNKKQNQFQVMISEMKTLGQALQRNGEALHTLEQLENSIRKTKQTIVQLEQEKQLETRHISFAQFLPGTPKIRLMTDDAVIMQALKMIGLEPAWKTEGGLGSYGYKTVDVGTLRAIDDAYFFYINERSDDYYLKRTIANPAWQRFPFVQKSHVYRMSEEIWPWGGPLAIMEFFDQFSAILSQKNNHAAI